MNCVTWCKWKGFISLVFSLPPLPFIPKLSDAGGTVGWWSSFPLLHSFPPFLSFPVASPQICLSHWGLTPWPPLQPESSPLPMLSYLTNSFNLSFLYLTPFKNSFHSLIVCRLLQISPLCLQSLALQLRRYGRAERREQKLLGKVCCVLSSKETECGLVRVVLQLEESHSTRVWMKPGFLLPKRKRYKMEMEVNVNHSEWC